MQRRLLLACALVQLAAPASAQFATARPAQLKPFTSATAPVPSGGFLVGTDDCNAPHRNLGTGDQFAVPFTTGTTGSEGQNEAACYAFGSTNIHNDVWFDWTADMTGIARVSTCAGNSVDTKIAVWPLSAGCPVHGASIACNDDACGVQTRVEWSTSAGTTYTIQLGTFPGASGGSGTFDIEQAPPWSCGRHDDGTSENALGLVAGGETGWLHTQDCLLTVDRIDTAYFTIIGGTPGAHPARIVCYEDADCDGDPTTPAGGMTLMWSVATMTVNEYTDILNPIPYPGDMGGSFTNTASSRCTFVMATAAQARGEFPAPMDQTNPTPRAWAVGQTPTGATLDLTNLNANNVAPLQTTAIGFPTAWLLRAESIGPCGDCHPITCAGDSGCPCGNDNVHGEGAGCSNSTGVGALLVGKGAASISSDGLVLDVRDTSNQPGLFFQGNDELGIPPTFGDGLRCCGTQLVRIGTYSPTGHATNTATGNRIGGVGPPISQHPGNAGLSAGDQRCYQWWYRDTVGGPCNSGFNLSNAALVVWGP